MRVAQQPVLRLRSWGCACPEAQASVLDRGVSALGVGDPTLVSLAQLFLTSFFPTPAEAGG